MKRFLAGIGGLLLVLRVLFSGYSKTGPFVNNANPAINATFFNAVENFLVTLNSASTDSNLSSSGGNLSMKTANLTTGSLTRSSKFSGTATTTPTFFSHGLGAVPDIVMLCLNGTSNSPHSVWCDYSSLTSTQAKITADGSNPFVGWAIKF